MQGLNRMREVLGLVLLAAVAAGCAPTPEEPVERTVAAEQTYSYTRDVQPIFETKCIACHACYDSPCQLNLTSAAGLSRGAAKSQVYDSSRPLAMSPTRLFVDAQTNAEWRQKGFFSVFNERGGPLGENLQYSLLYDMIELGRQHPLPANSAVPDDIAFGLGRENVCPTPGEFESYAKDKPLQGMPLAITGLSDKEYETLRQWILEGGVIDGQPTPAGPAERDRIRVWEAFFNHPAARNRLVARYLYEHLFAAHLYFDDLKTGNFFELVRSTTPPGEPVQVIATVRPNDDPGPSFYYRLRKLEETIVHKTHLPYALSARKRERFEALFFAGDWKVDALPDYSSANALNPFVAFAAIPARARYSFMLDNADYFVRTFIRGPVCAGQVATDVIEDRFFVLFQDPDSDLSVTDAGYLKQIEPLMILVPGTDERVVELAADWETRKHARNDYIRLRGQAYRAKQPGGPSLGDIWDGDRTNPSAALTVFRNYDNATVKEGLVGAVPETLWVMDYPILERTYYLLVANFDVFGSVASQLETRFYFDLLRSGGENNFLHFMPPGSRATLRDSWYRGVRAEHKLHTDYVIVNEDLPVQIEYHTPHPKSEFVTFVSEYLGPVAGPPDVLNRCAKPPCRRVGASPVEQQVEAQLQTIAARPAFDEGMGFVDFMPDIAFLRVRTASPAQDLAYTLVRDKAHTSVAFLFQEEKRREPEKDNLTVYRGLLGSYPNFIFDVPAEKMGDFTEGLRAARTREQFTDFVSRFGVTRTHPGIWEQFAWFVDYGRRADPIQAGIYDLNRYKKVADLMADETP